MRRLHQCLLQENEESKDLYGMIYFVKNCVPLCSQSYIIFTTKFKTVLILQMKTLRNKTPECIVLVYTWEEKSLLLPFLAQPRCFSWFELKTLCPLMRNTPGLTSWRSSGDGGDQNRTLLVPTSHWAPDQMLVWDPLTSHTCDFRILFPSDRNQHQLAKVKREFGMHQILGHLNRGAK